MSEDERFEQALMDLVADRSPRSLASELDPEAQELLRMAQLIRGSRPKPASDEFVARLHDRLFPPKRISRRAAVVSSLSALAAGITAGIGLDRFAPWNTGATVAGSRTIVPIAGKWHTVAAVDELPVGAVKRFSVGALQGFVVNRHGEVHALSGICTHLGCALTFKPGEQALLCPCHNAEFELSGSVRNGPGGYGNDQGVQIPPLPTILVRVRGKSVEVFGA
jgi:cytochrome b6-f complex iron-sulfur subunit